MKRIRKAGGGMLALAWMLGAWMSSAGIAQGQTVPPNQGVPTRDEITRPIAPVAPARTRLHVEGDIERSPCPLADPSYASIRLTISRATFGGLKGVTEAELEPAYRAYLGSNRPVSDICEIRDAVATVLRRKGYLAAVQVPTQKITDSEVHFEVLYAKLTAIRVRGDAGRSERLVASYLQKLTQEEVFNEHDAERYLLLARDLPGIDVHLALKPAGKPGEVYGEVTLVRTPVQASFSVQNLGAPETGRFGGQARIQFNGLTGLGDQTSVAFYSTADFREQQVLQVGHEFRVGSEGLQFGGHFTYAWTRPDLSPSPSLIRARTLFANVEARYPLLRTQAASLSASGGLDYVNQTVRFDTTRIAEDHIRVAYLRLDGDLLDRVQSGSPRWHLGYSAEFRQGLGIFGATRFPLAGVVPPSRIDGDARGTLVRGSLSGEASVVPNVSIAVNATGQYSFDPLLSFEEYSAGNYTIGRGYDPGTLLGDDGLGISGELRIDRVAPFSIPLAFQPFVFIDGARVWNKNMGSDDLLSVGGGVRTSFADRFRLDLTAAVPTRTAGLQVRRGDTRLLMTLTTKLWPWGGN